MFVQLRHLAVWFVCIFFFGCSCRNPAVPVVDVFDAARYVGRWYEIARLPNNFEEGLSNITAEYTLRGERVRVVNKGYDPKRAAWRSAEGRAYFTRGADIPELRVTFFWPFYGCYRVIALDQENYQYALVSGKDWRYLWLLSRSPRLEESVQEKLIDKAEQLGYDIQALIFVKHDLP